MRMFTTKRLRIRTWEEADLEALHGILSDPVTMAHWPKPYDLDGARAWLTRSHHDMREYGCARWCCELLDSGQVIGDVGIMCMQLQGAWIYDLGYIIHHPYWRRGMAFEAASGATAWARQQGIPALVATMATDNEASAATARKLGMRLRDTFSNPNNGNKPTYWFELPL